MVEPLESGLFLDLFFKCFHRAGDVEPLDAATLRADEVIVMVTCLQKGVIRATIVEAKATDEAELLQLDQDAIDGGLVCAAGEIAGFGDVGERERLMRVNEDGEDILQRFGASQAGFTRTFHHRGRQFAR